MAAVKKGGDRQKMHERIRVASMEATKRMKEGENCDLLSRLAADPDFILDADEISSALNPNDYTGRCAAQVDEFLSSLPVVPKSIDDVDSSLKV